MFPHNLESFFSWPAVKHRFSVNCVSLLIRVCPAIRHSLIMWPSYYVSYGSWRGFHNSHNSLFSCFNDEYTFAAISSASYTAFCSHYQLSNLCSFDRSVSTIPSELQSKRSSVGFRRRSGSIHRTRCALLFRHDGPCVSFGSAYVKISYF